MTNTVPHPPSATEARRTPGVEYVSERGAEHQVTPLELFFDLVMVFAFTQVTRLLVDIPTWGGVLRGMLVLAALWFAWNAYAWLTSAIDVDEGGIRLAMLGATAVMFGVALAVPGAFGDDALLFGLAYFIVRVVHLVLSVVVARDDPGKSRRFAPIHSDDDRRRLILRRGRFRGGGRAHRSVGGRSRDRLPRACRDRRRRRLARCA